MRILLIEDDKILASFIMKGFKEAGYSIDSAADGEEGLHALLEPIYDAAIVDIMLPKMDGYTIVAEARKRGLITPVIFLSAKREADDRIRGFRTGGDDYLVKPFVFTELLLRVQARIGGRVSAAPPTNYKLGDLEIDIDQHRALRGGRELDLNPREFRLLEYLLRNAGRVVSKTMIMQQVWDFDFDPETNVVEVCISRLRRKLNKDFDKEILRTVRGFGYILDKE